MQVLRSTLKQGWGKLDCICFLPLRQLVDFQTSVVMASIGLRGKDRLDGGGNWTLWRARIVLLLEKYELWEIVETVAVVPTDPTLLVEFKKKNIKAKRIILDSVKDHIIPHVSGRDFAYKMWESLNNLYQSSNQNRKMVFLRNLGAPGWPGGSR